MKTLQINLAIVGIFLMTSFTVNAQTNKGNTPSTRPIVTSKTIAQKPTRPVSDYMNMESKIKAWIITGNIPATLPKYKKGQTKEEYQGILRAWAKNNLNLIKKEYHAKVLKNPNASEVK